MISFKNVTYSYSTDKSAPVLKDISLPIESGEKIALMGGNGCGKTTLGLLLCGILIPDSGEIRIDGQAVVESRERPPIGFLFQDPDSGLVATTVEREVAFSLENQNMSPDSMQKMVAGTLRKFDLDQFRDRLVWNLSGGEKQRLSLAGIIAVEPKILFLDEPASFLDFAGSRMLDKILEQVARNDPTMAVIRVTQYPSIADRHDRIVVMNKGRILADDSPERVFSDESNLIDAKIRPPLSYLTPRDKIFDDVSTSDNTSRKTAILLTINKISFSHHCIDAPVLFHNLSMRINNGEVLALVGPSGSGKSTLAQLICGIHTPSKGAVDFVRKSSRGVISFQQPERQFFLDTAYDEVAYGIKDKINNGQLLDEIVRRNMNMVGLDYETYRNRDPHTLSGGEARRLAFAIVIALDADLVIFDEPTCGLDEEGIGSFMKLVENLKGDGRTVMIISHNTDIIMEVADRVALLIDGKIALTQSPMDFFCSDIYKGMLQVPEIIHYQQANYGTVRKKRAKDIFDLDRFYS